MPPASSNRLGEGPIHCDGAMGTALYASDPVRARLRDAGERALRARIERVHEVRRRRHAGAYFMPSFGRFEVVAEVLDAH